MPEIERKRKTRGVVVDAKGTFLAALEWPADQPAPDIQGRRKDGRKIASEDRKFLILDKRAIADPKPGHRWNKEAGEWVGPSDVVYLFDERSFAFVGARRVWLDGYEPPQGMGATTDAPPPGRASRAIWDREAGAWCRPRRVALIDPDGVVQNIVLENPVNGAEPVSVPKGWARVDDRDGWPVADDGSPLTKGAAHTAALGRDKGSGPEKGEEARSAPGKRP